MLRPGSTKWLLAVVLWAPTWAGAQAPSDGASPVEPDEGDADECFPDEVEEEDDAPRIHTYAASLGPDLLRFRLSDDTRMGLTGPSVAVDYTVGHAWGFAMRGAFTFPVSGRQHESGGSSETFNLWSMYHDRRGSYDLMFGFYRRIELRTDLTLVLAGGAHTRLVGLTDEQWQPVQLIQVGLSGFARVDYALDDHFFLGGEVYAGFDPVDFVFDHVVRAVYSAPMSAAFVVGARR